MRHRTAPRLSTPLLTLLVVVMLAPAASGAPRGKRRPRGFVPAAAVEPGPQCRVGRHALAYHGGDLVQHASVFVLFWGPEWSNDPEHEAAAQSLRQMYQQLGGSEYACSLREYALPGAPLGAGSYAGDEVIATEPVAPGQELDDGAIRAEIVAEAAAHHAPAPTDDLIYAVVPPKGVVVNGGGETGCGGSNFTFCGYHDSFTTGGQRVRYVVLPYPCDSGGFTCFVDVQESVAASLQAVGSHEFAETVTDPDFPPVAAGGWFDDRSGDENADICASDACLVDLPVGTDTFVVNSLWSNLGGDCVASAPCALPAAACTDPAPGACVTNAHKASACAFEWHVEPNLSRTRQGFAGGTIACADGEPFCDADGTADGQCTFHLAMCLNSSDPRVTCTPASVGAVQLRGKLAAHGDAADQANAATLIAALTNVDPTSTGTASGAEITYAPPATTSDACTGYVDVVVPVKTTVSGGAAGKRKFAVAAQTSAGKLTNTLKLVCNPTFP